MLDKLLCHLQQIKSQKWTALPPQDIIYGLDLKLAEHQQILKDVIQVQQPEVITLAPPCGPWSSWQRMRKRKDLLSALRREHRPFWEFVCWVWAHQTLHHGIVVLEQPAQSDALRMPMMSRREQVYQQEVHMCQMGVSGRCQWSPTQKTNCCANEPPCYQLGSIPGKKV